MFLDNASSSLNRVWTSISNNNNIEKRKEKQGKEWKYEDEIQNLQWALKWNDSWDQATIT